MTNKDVYRCYSERLKNYLLENNINYFLVANDIVTGKKFYAFEKNKIFWCALAEWEATNPKK